MMTSYISAFTCAPPLLYRPPAWDRQIAARSPSFLRRWGEPSDEEMMGFWLQFADPKLVDDKAAVAHK